MSKIDLINKLEKIVILMELKGENPFKIKAYKNAIRELELLDESIEDLIKNNTLKNVRGIGKALEENIKEYYNTKEISLLNELELEFPESIFELFKIDGLGPKKVKVLYKELNIESVGELEYACKENRLISLKGFGTKTQDKILSSIKSLENYKGKFLLSTGLNQANIILKELESIEEVIRVSLAGSIRRKKEVIKDIDILASVKDDNRNLVMDRFSNLEEVKDVLNKGITKSSVTLKTGINVDLRLVEDSEFPYALHHFTGSKEHNTKLRHMAKTKNIKINEYGIFKNDEKIKVSNEVEFFSSLGMEFIPPEIREGSGEIKLASDRKIPKLLTRDDIKGILHVHSNYSDGSNNIEELVKKAIDMNFKYIGISDHSKSAFYANGLNLKDIDKQHKEIDKLNKKYNNIKIYKGIESDILKDGSLDYESDVLEKFDYVIASIHSNLKQDKETVTNRLIKAVENPYTTILGHISGRLLLSREGYELDYKKVFNAMKKNNVAIEINSNPHRLDLDWRLCELAKKIGLKFTIDPDAHNLDGFKDIEYGIGIARKGLLEDKDLYCPNFK